ncbi:MAG: cobyrinate a,c-diamide synthase [Oscillospiraceae bacterium]|nr:cobyrinate a,c-diamide synthase [Oscillospiraceae bacterium]
MKHQENLPRVAIIGTGSGCGKTTVTCALMQALVNRGLGVSAFKCGPDYIDPMFHQTVIGVPSRNLDLFFCGEETVRYLFCRAAGKDLSVIEGVMGMYDGIGGDTQEASSNHLAMATETPEILVVNARGMSLSVAAMMEGFARFSPNRLAGVIFNGATAGMYPLYAKMAQQVGLRPLGYFPQVPQAAVESRHLGLVAAEEIEDLKEKMQILAQTAEESLDLDGILELAGSAPLFAWRQPRLPEPLSVPVRIGVARDAAFCFYYADNLELLEALGAKLIPFSPLHDPFLPEGLDGLYLGGGYPELHASALAKNETMRRSVRQAVDGGVPVIAECGGFLYLQQSLTDMDGKAFFMAGALPGEGQMTKRLVRFGYVTLTARRDQMICPAGEQIKGHSFHYSDTTQNGDGFIARKRRGEYLCAQTGPRLYAGYPHLYFWSNPDAAARFLSQCAGYQKEREA